MPNFTQGNWHWSKNKLEANDTLILETKDTVKIEDARLIECAPDMYQALIMCTGWVAEAAFNPRILNLRELAKQHFEQLNSLFARIGGEEDKNA